MQTGKSNQRSQLLRFMQNPRSYPHRPKSVSLEQTHASLVFIVPPFVFKVKKPVNLGFLDFSTLAKRHTACEREVTLNRRLAPTVYLGVVPITRSGNRLLFGGTGRVVEYAVQMRHLDPRQFLDHLIRRKMAGRAELNRIARLLVKFYRAEHAGPGIAKWGRMNRLRVSTDENFLQTTGFIGKTISAHAFAAIRFYTDGFYQRHRRLFEQRVREGWIRDCHGDLHLEHIHVTPRSISIYDCIEFNDRFRCVDIANDVAFLAMDLDYEHEPALARHFTGQMARLLGDRRMPRLLDFYKCYRAYVRGKVESIHSVAPAESPPHRKEAAERASRYFRLALDYAVAGSEPTVFAVMGRIGSGKSTLARALSTELGWQALSSDRFRKAMAGKPLFTRTSGRARDALYSAARTRATYAALAQQALIELRGGRNVILDATFSRRDYREALRKKLQRSGCHVLFIEAQASDAVIRARLKRRDRGESTVSDARLEDFESLTSAYEPPLELPRDALLKVPSGGKPDATLTRTMRLLVERQLRAG